ncbi:MAG: HAMP domain-containing histidine kinase [Actinomycetota bacterium]|nr:HAMP domain-containing histidine kinase [Actinomycetota bacterium]
MPSRWRLSPLKDMSIRWRLTLLNALIIGIILVILAGSFAWLWYEHRVDQVETTTRTQALEAARALEGVPCRRAPCKGEDLLGQDKDELKQATAGGDVVIVIRNAQGKVLGQMPEPPNKPDFSTGEIHDRVWKEVLKGGQTKYGDKVKYSEGADYRVHAIRVTPTDKDLAGTPTSSARVVEAGKPYPSVMGILEEFAPVLATVGLLGFVLLVGGAYLLTRAALSSVEAVVRAAGEMSEGDLSRRLPVANPKDEIGRLTTTINALLARLEVAFARLEETLSRQRRFAADASHELRTPLTSISGHARMLDEWALEEDKETAHRSVGTIRREAGRMRGLIESLLTLTRGDEGAPMEVGRYDLGAVGKEATETARAAADGRVSVEFVPNEREVRATFDRERVLQVASILLDNAVKHTPDGGSVTVRVEEEDGGVALAVSDTGIGISEDQLPLVFERFYRADSARAEEGVGLGLSIARQIAEAHGGTVEARSKLGVGSTFVLLLPRQRPGPPQGPRTQEAEDPG